MTIRRDLCPRSGARRVSFALVVAVSTSFGTAVASAATPLNAVRYAPDATAVLGGVTVTPQNVAEDDLAGTVSLVDVGAVPNGTGIVAYSSLANGNQLLAFDTTQDLSGGLTARPGDVLSLSGATYTLAFDAAANGIASGVIVDAVAQISPNDLLLSFDVTVALGSITAGPEDLVRFEEGVFSLFFDGSEASVPGGLNLDAADCLPRNGHLLLSFDGSGTVGGVSFDDEDVLEYSPESHAWSLAYDGSAQHAEWPEADLAAVSAAVTAPRPVAPVIGGGQPGPGGVGGQGLAVGITRIFGLGAPNAKPSDSCIEIYLVGDNGEPDDPPGSVDDQLIGTGGTDAAGNFVDGSDAGGIALTQPLIDGNRLFAFDACNDVVGATVFLRIAMPASSPALVLLLAGALALFGIMRLSRHPGGVSISSFDERT
jgi:hypothetical protein